MVKAARTMTWFAIYEAAMVMKDYAVVKETVEAAVVQESMLIGALEESLRILGECAVVMIPYKDTDPRCAEMMLLMVDIADKASAALGPDRVPAWPPPVTCPRCESMRSLPRVSDTDGLWRYTEDGWRHLCEKKDT